jgi:hypothetical protein
MVVATRNKELLGGSLHLLGLARMEMLEARGGIEPPIKVLQTFALPLGYRAVEKFSVVGSKF